MKSNRLLRAITNTRLDALPQDLITYLKCHILDAIGVSLAGAQTKTGQEKIVAAKNVNICKEATLIGDGTRVPTRDAFEVNSYLGNLLPINGSSYFGPGHPGRQVIYAALSVSEKFKVSLEDCIIATLISYELILQIGQGAQQILWPSNEPHPDPALGFCFSLSCLASVARKTLVNSAEDGKHGILLPLILDTLAILDADLESSQSDCLKRDDCLMKLGAAIEGIRLTKSTWHRCLTKKRGLRPTPFDRFIVANLSTLEDALNSESMSPRTIKHIVLKAPLWLNRFMEGKGHEVKTKIANALYLYLYGVELRQSFYINRQFDRPEISNLSGKIKFTADWEDFLEHGISSKCLFFAQVHTTDGRILTGKRRYPILAFWPLESEKDAKNKFRENAEDIIGTKQCRKLHRKIRYQEYVRVPELMELTYPKVWSLHMLRKSGLLSDKSV